MSNDADSIASLTAEIERFVNDRDWDQFHDPKNLVMLLGSEVGELTAEFRWVSNADADLHASGAARGRVEDEMADVAIALLMLSRRMNTDLPSVIRAKLAKNARKYPVDRSRGSAEAPSRER